MEHRKKKDSLPNILRYSTIIKNRWKTLDKVGAGAFGEIYGGLDLRTCNEVAVKVERCDSKKMVLKLEVIALKKLQKSNHVVRYIHSGRQDHFNYLIMERLGDNLATLLKRSPRGVFSLCTTVKIAIQILDALESIHNLGYIHRDVKPSNFCLFRDPKRVNQICLIDFNLARRYILSTGAIRPPRKHAGFRGTARYASISSHHSKELSRRDDLWSVFYILVEFATGQLPWKRLKDKKHIGELKERFTNAELVKDLPPEFLLLMQHLHTLKYEDKPDYNYMRSILYRIYSREGYPRDFRFDWEVDSDDEEEGEGEVGASKEEEKSRTRKKRKGSREQGMKRKTGMKNVMKSKSQQKKKKKAKKVKRRSVDNYDYRGRKREMIMKRKSSEKRSQSKKREDGEEEVGEEEDPEESETKERGEKEEEKIDGGFALQKYRKRNSQNQPTSPKAQRKEQENMARYFSPSSNQKCCGIL